VNCFLRFPLCLFKEQARKISLNEGVGGAFWTSAPGVIHWSASRLSRLNTTHGLTGQVWQFIWIPYFTFTTYCLYSSLLLRQTVISLGYEMRPKKELTNETVEWKSLSIRYLDFCELSLIIGCKSVARVQRRVIMCFV
jgi:hypothetical protein